MFNPFKTLWNKDKSFGFFFTVSALSHILIFIFFLFTSADNNRLTRNINAIDVNLISISKASSAKSKVSATPKKTSGKSVTIKKPKQKKEAAKKIKKAHPKKAIPQKNAIEAKKKKKIQKLI